MYIWLIVPIAIAVAAASAFLARKNLPRDLTREKENTPESTLAYERVSSSLPFIFIRAIVLRELKSLQPKGNLIDIGCGPGFLLRDIKAKYPRLSTVGLDLSDRSLRLAMGHQKDGAHSNFLHADAARIPLADNSIDIVVSTLSLHHWRKAECVLSEVYRILKPGGKLLIFDLRREVPYALYYGGMGVQRWLSPPSIREVNGLMGSLYSSYTIPEMKRLLQTSPLMDFEVKRGWGWAYMRAQKTDISSPRNVHKSDCGRRGSHQNACLSRRR